MDRRGLLRTGGRALLFAGLVGSPVMGSAKFVDDPFSLGVASGDPWPDGFVLWTRLAPRPLEPHGGMDAVAVAVGWEVAEDEQFRRIVRAGQALARPELAHSVHVEVGGLGSGRHYWYRFFVEGISSDIGTVRTAPAPGERAEQLRIAVGGCQNFQAGLFTTWRHVANEPDLDLVYHYGDYIYESKPAGSTGTRSDRPPVVRQHTGGETYSLDDYRRRYALYKSDPDLKAAHAAAAFVQAFDDHEVDNDWAGALDQDGTPPEIFLLRRAAAMQAWYEHMPVRKAQFPRGGLLTMYRRLDFGSLLRMHVMDNRSFRSIQLCEKPTDRNCVSGRDEPDTMWGAEQERWLAGGLTDGAVWNLLALQGFVMPFDRTRQTGSESKGYDNWSGYPDARLRLIRTIEQRNLTNVVITGGDSHMFFVGHVPSRPDDLESSPVATEFHATSISSNSGNGFPIGPDPRGATNPHMQLVHDQRGYLLFEVSPEAWRVEARVIDQAYTPGGKPGTLARFVVEPRRPKILAA
jgi:alkaline phosphatase D